MSEDNLSGKTLDLRWAVFLENEEKNFPLTFEDKAAIWTAVTPRAAIAFEESKASENGGASTSDTELVWPECPGSLHCDFRETASEDLSEKIARSLQEYYPDYHFGQQDVNSSGPQKDLETVPQSPAQEKSEDRLGTDDLKAALPSPSAPGKEKIEELQENAITYAVRPQS
ncbi:hypothetical protein LQW54_001002 [Pestalotiopsis sp. IQ-011]